VVEEVGSECVVELERVSVGVVDGCVELGGPLPAHPARTTRHAMSSARNARFGRISCSHKENVKRLLAL
jgi:hypothetical protein